MARKAFGTHNARTASLAKQARNIAESMQRFVAEGQPKALAFYGVSEESELGQAVLALVAKKN
jgi:hypothetical protein